MKVIGLMCFGWGCMGIGVGVVIFVSWCMVFWKLLVVVLIIVVGMCWDVWEWCFMVFKGFVGLDVEGFNVLLLFWDCCSVGDGVLLFGLFNGCFGGVVGVVVDCGSDVRYVRSVFMSVSCLGLFVVLISLCF